MEPVRLEDSTTPYDFPIFKKAFALGGDGAEGCRYCSPVAPPTGSPFGVTSGRRRDRTTVWIRDVSEAIQKETACFQGATVMALHGRAIAVAKTRPCKAMTVAPKASNSHKLQHFDFSDSRLDLQRP